MLTLADVWAGVSDRPLPPHIPGDLAFHAVVHDSRQVTSGDLFVALRGETHDGHDFIAEALRRGARGVLAARLVGLTGEYWILDARQGLGNQGIRESGNQQVPPVVIMGDDTLAALQRLAGYWRDKFAVEVIGVTGSVGKTTTKEVIAAVLGRRFRVLKNEKNLNNEIGLPLSLLQLGPEHQKAVLEMGMYARGEIRLLCQIARPRLGVITNVGPTHLERLGTIEAIAQAKAELVESLPADGFAILNGDDPRVRQMATRTLATVFIYGQEHNFDLWADEVSSHGLEGLSLRLHYGREAISLQAPLLGAHSVHTVLAAAAVGLIAGLTWEEIVSGLRHVPEQLRLLVVPGQNGATLIDDTYNSSPASALAALNLLAEMPGRHLAVLGDMLELGNYEAEGHRLVGRRAAEVAAALLAVGPRGRLIGEEARAVGMPAGAVHLAADNAAAIAILQGLLQPGDFVLIKGSRGMALEGIVSALRTD
ncbi:MAG: UDP-N-acetylmuramoyl-tripeptide--D-alanyl-D-alanine ligase [Chloroflexi bacterium]|nr:UDP-N-acetylmuramoyl-tripeptide--D-alanyl-D-alanine ligase [Chloroflexota bacterium]